MSDLSMRGEKSGVADKSKIIVFIDVITIDLDFYEITNYLIKALIQF